MAQVEWPGYVDPAFTALCAANASADNTARAIVIQDDGRIVGAGSFLSDVPVAGAACQDAIFRCGSDGAIDPTFASPFGQFTEISSLALGAGGKIVVAGNLGVGGRRYAVARLGPTGALDPLFALTQSNPPSLAFLTGHAVAIDGAGRVVYGGTAFQAGFKPFVKRLKEDGSEDSSFAGGVLNTNGLGRIWALAIQADDKVVVGGNFTNIGTAFRYGLARLNSNGSLDDTFRTTFVAPSVVSGVKLLDNGKLLVAGWLTTDGSSHRFLMQLNPNGSIDPGFELVAGGAVEARKVEVGPAGRIYVTHQQGILRFDASGQWDVLYAHGAGGIGGVSASGYFAVAVDSSGRALVGCEFVRLNGVERRGLVRLQGGVAVPPRIEEQPLHSSAEDGETAVFTVQASGGAPLSFRWYTGSTVIGSGSRLTLNQVTPANDGLSVYCVVTNLYGQATSSVAALRVFSADVPVGDYHGLFHETNGVYHPSSGSIKVSLRTGGAFSAVVRQGAASYRFSGKFDPAGLYLGGSSRQELSVQLAYDRHGRDRITGTINGGDWVAGLTADRAEFDAINNPATNYAGRYTFVVAGSAGHPTQPAGHGAGVFAVNPAGLVKMAGLLADGTPMAANVPISSAGVLPLYVPLYRGRGSVLGWIQITNSTAPDLGGRLNWSRRSGAPPTVNIDGFEMETMLVGSGYRGPGTNAVFAGGADASVAFAEGNLAAAFEDHVTLLPKGKFGYVGTNELSLKLSATKGTFSGSVTPPGSKKAVRFKGAILEKQRFGAGFFLGTNQSGRIEIE